MLNSNEIWSLLHNLSEQILASNSATEALQQWCAERGIADEPIEALCNRNCLTETMDSDSLEALYPYQPNQQVEFRCVQLAASGVVLVDALNWYFPSNLTVDICRQLKTTKVPFGRAIKDLKPARRTFLVRRCAPEQLRNADISLTAFEHRAVVYDGSGRPLAVVHERFKAALVLPIPASITFAATGGMNYYPMNSVMQSASEEVA